MGFPSGLKLVNFRLSPTTIRRMEEIALAEHRKDADLHFGIGGKLPTKTDVLRMLVNRAYDAIQAAEPEKLIDVLSKPKATPKAKGKDKCKEPTKTSSKIARTVPNSAKKRPRSISATINSSTSADTSRT